MQLHWTELDSLALRYIVQCCYRVHPLLRVKMVTTYLHLLFVLGQHADVLLLLLVLLLHDGSLTLVQGDVLSCSVRARERERDREDMTSEMRMVIMQFSHQKIIHSNQDK